MTNLPAPALDPSLPPGKNFDLSRFKLQTPMTNGSSVLEIYQPALATWTSNYFYTAADGAMTFWCPVTGATTPNTTYARSELRELASGGDWSLTGTHVMTAQCKVTQVPSNGRTIIGQIHGNLSQSELLKLRWDNGLLEARVQPDRNSEIGLSLGTHSLNALINYTVQMVNGILTVTVNGHTVTYDYTASEWQSDGYYFKAGDYPQDNSGTSSEGARVAFYALSVAHGRVSAPTFSPVSGTYTTAQTVALSCTTSGASIRYTTDGSTPTSTNGTLYLGPLPLATTTTLKAIAYKDGMVDSTVSSAAYTILTYTLTYTAGPGGSISGPSPQVVYSGGNGAAVGAVADTAYHFANWSDGGTQNPRTDVNVTTNLSVTANFLPDTLGPLAIEWVGAVLRVSWTGPGQFQWAPTVSGPWQDVAPTGPNVYETDPVEERAFYRLKQ